MSDTERYHIYGGSGLLAFYFIIAAVIWITSGASGEEVSAAIDYYAILFFIAAISVGVFRTIRFGYPGREKGLGFVIGFMGAVMVMVIFNVFLGLSFVLENMLVGVMAAFAEELFCRGFVYPILMRWSGDFVVSAGGSSLVWAVLHVFSYGWNWTILIYLMCTGFVYAAAMEKAQSLDVPITVHLLNNVIVALGLFGGI